MSDNFIGSMILNIADFSRNLKALYASLTPTQIAADTKLPSHTQEVIKLAVIKSTVVRCGHIRDKFIRQRNLDAILQDRYPVQLENIFKETEGKRKVVLLEGAPGCGKSTLSVYICQQWGEDKLFDKEFDYVFLVQLRDPEVQNASSIADLLPVEDDEMRKLAFNKICANYGERVLFILDGWDELPPNLRKDSVLYEMIKPNLKLSQSPLLKSSVVITSRPIASGDLHRVVSSRIEILGFTSDKLNDYFTKCLAEDDDTNAVETLLERINENPAIASTCFLPMNANILVHLFKSDNNTLPTTQYGIFSEFVLSCIDRHLNERTQLKDLTLESLQEIPEIIKKPFLYLCKLAYQGIMDNKVIFSSLPTDINTLGLLQGVQSFIRRGKVVSYNFLHLSIQETLAGIHMATQLPDNEQVSKFNELLDNSRLSAVLQFYAAITKLQTPGIKNVVIRIVNESNKTLLLSLLHCLYEAQDPSLCESVAWQLGNGLDLTGTTLTLSDCLCIGYFLSHACKITTSHFEVNLQYCYIRDIGCKYLVNGLHKSLDTDSEVSTVLTINLANNTITHFGVHNHLSTLLKVDCIEGLGLGSVCLMVDGENLKIPGGNKLQSLQGTMLIL